jgi:hypothetical protein
MTGVLLIFFNIVKGENVFLTRPCQRPVTVLADSIDDVLKSISISQTKEYIAANDKNGCIKSLEPVSVKIADYMGAKYTDFDIKTEVKEYPLEVAVMGVFQLLKEKNYLSDYSSNSAMRNSSGSFDCFSAALGGLLGVNEINSLYHDFTHGVSPRTVFKAMKTMLRRVAGAITIAWTVVELVLCLFD